MTGIKSGSLLSRKQISMMDGWRRQVSWSQDKQAPSLPRPLPLPHWVPQPVGLI